jgi:hypothetical protein
MTQQASLAGLTVSTAPPPTRRDADTVARRAIEARAVLLPAAVKRCKALAVQIADDEAWCCAVEANLRDPAFAQIPADDRRRVRAHDDLRATRSRLNDLQNAFAHWRQKADAAWEEMDTAERWLAERTLVHGIALDSFAMWFYLGDVLMAEYVRVSGPICGESRRS